MNILERQKAVLALGEKDPRAHFWSSLGFVVAVFVAVLLWLVAGPRALLLYIACWLLLGFLTWWWVMKQMEVQDG